ncbi:MAG: carbamoyltransferase HypF, partial [Eubacteriales bacterium]
MNEKKTYEVQILGLVQGVGFRPFVVQSAKLCGINGWVKNSGGIVTMEANGTPEDIKHFLEHLQAQSPPGADITSVLLREIPHREFFGFSISASGGEEGETPFIPPDLPLCSQCREELYNKQDRRYMNPFISCVSCGPRYSIIAELPYDRCRTTMNGYKMCSQCTKEYQSGGRRDFAQTISCNDCGPFLVYRKDKIEITEEAAFSKAVQILNGAGVLAIKGIGGYHFACSPFSAEAVRRLRQLKQRDKKPFAVMFKYVEDIRKFCQVSEREERLLLSSPRPIVLLPYSGTELQADVCCESRYLGAFLPYTPLQEMLMDVCGPLVMTSANLTDQPILTQDADVIALSSKQFDGVLYNTRRIVTPEDDSVMRVAADREQVIRRSRGIVPLPVQMSVTAKKPLFAAGADLKAAFCLMAGDRGYVSQHIGDLENADASGVYRSVYRHMTSLFSIKPELAACDMHPDYFSSRFAAETGLPLVTVQHHHAHIASVMAEHGIKNKIIGIAFDGTGYGEDGAIWGGEFLVCGGSGFRRAGHL